MQVLLTFFLITSISFAQNRSANRSPSAADVDAGGRIYRSHCAECHGLKGEGGRGPDLTRGEYRHGSSDAALARTISRGIPGTQMPGIYHDEYQVQQLVAFVRSLAGGGPRTNPPGNAANGSALFRGKGGCAACHAVAGEGGRSGPDLSYIGSMRTPAHLRSSVLEPDKDLSPAWWWVEAAGPAGSWSGLRLNEDTYTIQILDAGDRLVSLEKAKLTRLDIDKRKSRMPSYQGKLSPSEIDDLVAYLYSLQRKARTE